jgi:predicted enzyme related to lactoylglutathione lyase
MFSPVSAFSGYSVINLEEAQQFYSQVLGLQAETNEMGVQLHLPGGTDVFLYQKGNHVPATYTVLNLVVSNIDEAVADLLNRGITFEQYGMAELPQDEKGIARGLLSGMGPDIAWFTDPSGNILSVMQETEK